MYNKTEEITVKGFLNFLPNWLTVGKPTVSSNEESGEDISSPLSVFFSHSCQKVVVVSSSTGWLFSLPLGLDVSSVSGAGKALMRQGEKECEWQVLALPCMCVCR